MLIAQISDFHIMEPDAPIEAVNQTALHLKKAVDHINAMNPLPDVVLGTGDLVNKGKDSEYAILRELLAPLKPPILLIPGNHDHRENMRAAFPDHSYLNQDPRFIHFAIEDYALRLIGLDTLIPNQPSGELCADRCNWLDDRLREKPTAPTIVFLHHPPFKSGLWHMDSMGLSGSDRLAAVIEKHSQVERVLCGHLHRPITTAFANTIASVAPGTAHQIELALGGNHRLAVIMEPPCCLIHSWTPGEGLVSHTSYIGEFDIPIVLAED